MWKLLVEYRKECSVVQMVNFKILITICLILCPYDGALLSFSCFAYNFNSATRCEVSVFLVLHSVIMLCCKYRLPQHTNSFVGNNKT